VKDEARWLAPPLVVTAPWLPEGLGGGQIKATPEDFVVEEIPAYVPSGEGDFHYLWIEKVDVSGPALGRLVAERLGLPREAVGMAGLKDRHARTRQWVSVPAAVRAPLDAIEGNFGGTGEVRLLATSRHTNALKTGHLRGNRFVIRVRGRAPEADAAFADALATAVAHGFPNTFGAQRFSGGDTVARGLRMLEGKAGGPPRLARLAASAVQGSFFNHWLAARAADGLLVGAVVGDVMIKRDSGGVFICEDPAAEVPRLMAGEIAVTGPMPGSRPSRAQRDALARELALHDALGVGPEAFAALRRLGRGARRAALAWPVDASVAREGDDLVARFALPAGCYATVLLAQLAGPQLLVGAEEEPVDDGDGA